MSVFWYSGALPSDTSMFVGRDHELGYISRLCDGEVERYVIILGARQSGKTSLLYQLPNHLSPRAQVVVVNLQGLPRGKSAEVFQYIAEELVVELSGEGPTIDSIHNAASLRNLLCDLMPKRTTVICIDEIGTIEPLAADDLANALRSFHQDRLRSRYEALRHYVFVLAGGVELYRLAASNVSTLYSISARIYLGDLSRSASDELLMRGFRNLGMKQPIAGILCEQIFQHAYGHPYLTQRFGGFVEQSIAGHGRAPTSADLANLAADLADDDANIVSLTKSLEEEELLAKARLLAHGEKMPFSRIASVPSRLELIGLTRKEGENCVIRNPIYERVIRGMRGSGARPLKDIPPGREHAKVYEQHVFEMLRGLFVGQLSHPARESRTVDGTERRDIIFYNNSSHRFWQMLREEYDATNIIFECKNTTTLDLEHVNQLIGYLDGAIGRFGVLVSRDPPRKNIQRKAVNAFNRSSRIVILFLSDEDLAEMAQLDARSGDPTEVIERKYVELIRQVQ